MSNLPEAEWSEEVNQAKALLVKEGFQVLNVGSIDMIGAFNNHVHQVRGLLADRKELREQLLWIKVKNYADNNKTASFVKMVEEWYNDNRHTDIPAKQMIRLGDMAVALEERLIALMRPNQPQEEIENRRPIFHSWIINKIVAERNRLKGEGVELSDDEYSEEEEEEEEED
jgi:hypothetical protein